MAQLMPLPLTVSCLSKIQISFAFLVPAHPGSSRKGAVKCVVYVCVCTRVRAPFITELLLVDWTCEGIFRDMQSSFFYRPDALPVIQPSWTNSIKALYFPPQAIDNKQTKHVQ